MKKLFFLYIVLLATNAAAAQNVGIGTSNPTARLHVIGTFKLRDGSQGAGKILTSNATGLASWQSPPSSPGTNDPSVSICCQRWMTKNLDVSTYRNGDAIPKVTDAATWLALTSGAYCYYNNDSATYAATYGKLYNGYAVKDPRGLAPLGWYIPTDWEWTTLTACLGGEEKAGGLMKEIGTTHWEAPNEGAKNLSGFTSLPGGLRFEFGASFTGIGVTGIWWSSTEESPNGPLWIRGMGSDGTGFSNAAVSKINGFSVRCLRD